MKSRVVLNVFLPLVTTKIKLRSLTMRSSKRMGNKNIRGLPIRVRCSMAIPNVGEIINGFPLDGHKQPPIWLMEVFGPRTLDAIFIPQQGYERKLFVPFLILYKMLMDARARENSSPISPVSYKPYVYGTSDASRRPLSVWLNS